jgi:hypothetical protein
MLSVKLARSLYQASRLSSLMPTQKDMQSQIAGKVNFEIQLLRKTAELLETSPRSTSIDVFHEALSLSAPTKCRAARRIALKQTGTSRCRFSRVLKREKRLARESRGRLGIFGPSRARQTGVGFRRRAAKRNVPKFLELNGSVDALGRPNNNTLSQSGSRCCHRAAIIRRVR